MYDKSPMEIINGEMLIFGQPLPRHPEFPWLFSATHLHKFCEEAIRKKAESVGKDPDKFYAAKRPGEWIRFNILSKESKERVERYAEHTRKRINKYGPNLGFSKRKSDAMYLASQLDSLTDMDVVCVTAKGNSKNVLQGSYLCQLAIVQYIETFSEKFKARVQDTFISMVNGEVETVTEEVEANARKARGTPTRDLNVVFIKQFQEVCLRKGLNSRILMEDVNQLVFGMSKKEFMDKYGVDEPFNDNVPVHFIALKNMLLSSVTGSLMACPQTVLNNAAAKLLISKMAKPLLKAVSQEALNERQEKLFSSSTWARLVCTPN
jgi:hypothetical protein